MQWATDLFAKTFVVKPIMKLLFICTHNRCRSILAEAITNEIGDGRLFAKSAGSQPVGNVHPLTLKYLNEANIASRDLKSESWDVYESWSPDVVITVCDSAAGESCPVWFGKSLKVHWGLSDPSITQGNEGEVADAFRNTINIIVSKLKQLLATDFERLDSDQLLSILNKIGEQ